MKKKKIWIILIILIFLIGSLYLFQKLLMPKYMSGVVEGSLISEYYDETSEHDVLFIGDCEVYENFSPITLWEEYGITSYIRGSAQQLTWQSYYLLEDTLKYETPEVVVFNVLALKYNEPQKEAYNRMTLDGMKFSSTKIDAIKASMTEEENIVDYLFPILRYHSRISELTSDDFKYMFEKEKVSHSGYYMRVDVKAAGDFPTPRKLSDYEFGDYAMDYLDKITQLCKENNIELILIKSPTLYPYWYEEWDQQVIDYANKNNLEYLNMVDMVDEIGLDFNYDTYDGGLHMNLTGAEKTAHYFGEYLVENYNLEDHRSDSELSKIWQDKVDYYNYMKADQYAEIEEYGYLKRFIVEEE